MRTKSINPNYIPGAQKAVRIDDKTQILVSVSIPDDVARNRFLDRIALGPRAPYASLYPETAPEKEAIKDLSLGSLEELSTIIDDGMPIETE